MFKLSKFIIHNKRTLDLVKLLSFPVEADNDFIFGMPNLKWVGCVTFSETFRC